MLSHLNVYNAVCHIFVYSFLIYACSSLLLMCMFQKLILNYKKSIQQAADFMIIKINTIVQPF